MTDRACSEPASFSGYDRRRLALTLTQTSDIRLFWRVPAVLRVAEGDPIRSGARALCVSGRSGPRWLEIYRHRRHPEDWLDAPRSGRPRGDVLRFTDWTRRRRFPPRRAAGSRVGEPARGPVTGRKAQRVRFGAIHVHTGPRVGLCRQSAGGAEAQAFLWELRRPYRKAPTLWLLLDRAPAPPDGRTLRLARALGIERVWWPRPWPERNARDQLWRKLKRLVAANRQAETVDHLARQAENWLLEPSPQEALRKAGVLSENFWLKHLLQSLWPPT